jgi:citrate lyase subunit beta / citryl-CoA lyase
VTLPRTYLFVPGNRPERFEKALAAGADAVIVDLEDAVAPGDKDAARAGIANWLAGRGAPAAGQVLVRINDALTPWFADDLRMLREAGLKCAMLPKAEGVDALAAVSAALGEGGAVIALVESARGVRDVDAVASAPGVQRLAFGTIDYAVDLDLAGDELGLLYAANRIAVASRSAGIASPVAGVTAAIDDESRLLADLASARSCGFGAKLCIHPRQVAPIHAALAPSAAELDWARRVIAALESGSGAVQVDGRMVDRPVALRAQALLARARP